MTNNNKGYTFSEDNTTEIKDYLQKYRDAVNEIIKQNLINRKEREKKNKLLRNSGKL